MQYNQKHIICSEFNCYRKHYAKGLCRLHWTKRNKTKKATIIENFGIFAIRDFASNLKPTIWDLDRKYIKKIIGKAIAKLSKSEIYLIRHRFLQNKPLTLYEIGQHFKRSPERIRQWEAKALRKIRYSLYQNKEIKGQ